MTYRAALNIEDLHRLAKKRLPRIAYEFLTGGVEDDVTLRNNRAVFDRIRLRPHTLVDVSGRSQQVSVCGKTFQSPFGIAPTGAAGLYGYAADVALACAARDAGVPFVLSTGSFEPLEKVAREAAGGGEAGARHAIGILRSEIDRVLALIGCASVRELNADYLQVLSCGVRSLSRGSTRRRISHGSPRTGSRPCLAGPEASPATYQACRRPVFRDGRTPTPGCRSRSAGLPSTAGSR